MGCERCTGRALIGCEGGAEELGRAWIGACTAGARGGAIEAPCTSG